MGLLFWGVLFLAFLGGVHPMLGLMGALIVLIVVISAIFNPINPGDK